MAAKIKWHRYGTKLRHCHPMYKDGDAGGVATYLRCGGVADNQIKKGLLPSLLVNFFKSVNIWQRYKQEGGCLVHFVCLATTLLKD